MSDKHIIESPNVQKAIEEYPELGPILRDPLRRLEEKKKRAINFLNMKVSELNERKSWAESELALKKKQREACGVFEEWLKQPAIFQKNDCSRLHKLMDAFKAGHVVFADDHPQKATIEDLQTMRSFISFVIEHDWVAAFKGAEDFDFGSVPLPYEKTAFEFRISTIPIIVFIVQNEQQETVLFSFAEIDEIWIATDSTPKFFNVVRDQIRAVSIALDAEVAIHKVVRAPAQLNKKRENLGKYPLFDYHMVKLNRDKTKPAPMDESTGTHRSPRLHFRRGHWRHYETFKTWIKWTLVGNPDLGFIDKHYSL